jgi:hypothetical protein
MGAGHGPGGYVLYLTVKFFCSAALLSVSNSLSSLKFVGRESDDPLVLILVLTRWLRSWGFRLLLKPRFFYPPGLVSTCHR